MKRFRIRIILKNGFERVVIYNAESEKDAISKILDGGTLTINGAELPLGGTFWWIVGEIAGIEILGGTI